MKILFINDYYDRAGGAEKHILSLMKGLKKKGHDTVFFALGEKDEQKENIFIRKRTLSPRRSFFDKSTFKYLVTLIKTFQPDILHLHNTIFFSLYFHFNLDKFGIPVIKTVHDFRVLCPSGWLLLPNYRICSNFQGNACMQNNCLKHYHIKKIELIINMLRSMIEKHKINYFISPSTPLQKALLKNSFKNVRYLPNFISHDNFMCKSLIDEEKKIILYMGRLGREKGVHNLISAMKEIFTIHPETELVIAGKGDEKENLKKQAKELNIEEKVLFKGYVENVKKLYQKAYLVVFPSIWMENCPLATLEAMACGKAVIASKIGGFADIIEDGKNGFLVNPNNIKELASAITKLLENTELTLKTGHAAQKASERYDLNIYLENLLGLYKEALHTKQIKR